MNYDQVLTTVVSAAGVVLAVYLARKVVGLVESGVSFFKTRENQARAQTIDAVKQEAVRLGVMKTEQMVVVPAKRTGAWKDIAQRQHARDYAIETVTRYLERRRIVSPNDEVVAMIEAKVAEAKIEVTARCEKAAKGGG